MTEYQVKLFLLGNITWALLIVQFAFFPPNSHPRTPKSKKIKIPTATARIVQ